MKYLNQHPRFLLSSPPQGTRYCGHIPLPSPFSHVRTICKLLFRTGNRRMESRAGASHPSRTISIAGCPQVGLSPCNDVWSESRVESGGLGYNTSTRAVLINPISDSHWFAYTFLFLRPREMVHAVVGGEARQRGDLLLSPVAESEYK